MDAAPAWAAVVVEYQSGPMLEACLRSILADDSAGAIDVVVVDNGSTGAAVTPARDLPAVRVLAPGENLGYAGGINLGVAATDAPVVAMLNADLVVERGTAAAMLRRLRDEPDLAAVGPVLRNPDGSQYPSARTMPTIRDAVGHALLGVIRPTNRFTRRYRQLDVDPRSSRDVDWVSGAAMWVRRSALDSVGGWDEGYFMYMEDVDLCWRLRRLGWRVAYEPGGAVTHVQGVSTARHPVRMIVRHHRSVYRFADKRWRGARRLLLVPAAVLLVGRAIVEIVARGFGARPGRPQVRG